VVLALCRSTLTHDGPIELGEDEREENRKFVEEMASEPLRVISFAYAEMSLSDWEDNYSSQDGFPERILEEAISNDQLQLTFIANFGLKDQIRPKVPKYVKFARVHGHLGVRMVSGDHIETAKATAIRAGILKPEEVNRNFAVMEAEEFRAKVGSLV